MLAGLKQPTHGGPRQPRFSGSQDTASRV